MRHWSFLLLLAAVVSGFNLTFSMHAEEKDSKWVPLVSDKTAITAPPEIIKKAFSQGIDGGYLAVNPRNGDLYVEGHACLRSTDGGKTYAPVTGNLNDNGSYPFCADIHSDGKKIAVFGWCDVPGCSGSAYSLDGGKTWEAMASFDDPTKKGRGGITSGALEPGDGKTVLARGYTPKNLFLSPDLGKTWTALAKPREGLLGLGRVQSQGTGRRALQQNRTQRRRRRHLDGGVESQLVLRPAAARGRFRLLAIR